jgi:hypothetical protein
MESESCRLEIGMTKTWQFDQEVAKTFVDHAQKHIPDYDRVINKSVEVCQKLLLKDAAIIDVGCATGDGGRLHRMGSCSTREHHRR